MGRRKMKSQDKKSNFGITLDTRVMKLLEDQSEIEGLSKSQLIENILREKLNSEK